MKRLIPLSLAALLLVGCTQGFEDAAVATGLKKYDTITFQRGEFYKAYTNLAITYAVAVFQIRVACRQGSARLDADICQNIDRIDDQARMINDSVLTALANPEATVDWAQIMKYAQLGMDLAMRLGIRAVIP